MVCTLSSAIISLSFSAHLSNTEHGKRKHILLHPTAKTCKYHGLLLPSCFFFLYLMQLFSNYRRKTTCHYTQLHTSLGIYCYHYSGVILKPTKCTYFVLKKPQNTLWPDWIRTISKTGLPCFPKIPVPVMSVHTTPHCSIKNYLKIICHDTQTRIEYPGITVNIHSYIKTQYITNFWVQ